MAWPDTVGSGWGKIYPDVEAPESSVLQYVKVPPVSDDECNSPASYNGAISESLICAGQNIIHKLIKTKMAPTPPPPNKCPLNAFSI